MGAGAAWTYPTLHALSGQDGIVGGRRGQQILGTDRIGCAWRGLISSNPLQESDDSYS